MRAGPGRPRDETVDERVVSATLELLSEVGLGALTIESIASRAGVSKSSIYRRWDSKEEIIIDAVAAIAHGFEILDTGDLRRDLVHALDALRTLVSDTRAGEVFPWLVSEIARGSDIGLLYGSTVVQPRRQAIMDLIVRARNRGEVRRDLDAETAVDVLTGPILLRRMSGRIAETPADWPETIVDTLLTGWLET